MSTQLKISQPKSSLFDMFVTYFSLINFAIADPSKQLSGAEIKLLALFMSLDNEKYKYHRFSTTGKKKVIELAEKMDWNISSININNKIYSLILKGFLFRDEDNVIYLSKKIESGINELIKDKKITIAYEIHYKESSDQSDDPK